MLLKLAGPRHQAPTRQRLGRLRVRALATSRPADPPAPTSSSTSSTTARTSTRWRGSPGCRRDEVVAAHTAAPLRVGFGGFAPGFAYLVGGDERLHVPRRAEPRTKVPAGSVGLAGEFSGVYPRESPGGWQLIGRTDAVLWDVDRDPPALLIPGMLGAVPGDRS